MAKCLVRHFSTFNSSVVSYVKKLHFSHLAFPLGSSRVQLSSFTALQNLQSRQKPLLIHHKLSPPLTSATLQTLSFRGCPLFIPTTGPSGGVLNCTKLIPISGQLMATLAKDLFALKLLTQMRAPLDQRVQRRSSPTCP